MQKLFYENRTIIEKEIKMCVHGLRNSGRFCFWDIDEISQQLRIKAFESLRSYDPKRAKLKTYLKRVLERKIIDLLRREKSEIRNGNLSLEYALENIELGNAKKAFRVFYFPERIQAGSFGAGRRNNPTCKTCAGFFRNPAT